MGFYGGILEYLAKECQRYVLAGGLTHFLLPGTVILY